MASTKSCAWQEVHSLPKTERSSQRIGAMRWEEEIPLDTRYSIPHLRHSQNTPLDVWKTFCASKQY